MHTFYFKDHPADFEDSLIVEVDRDGEIIRADALIKMFDRFRDCTDWVKSSSYWTQRIQNKFNSLEKDDDVA